MSGNILNLAVIFLVNIKKFEYDSNNKIDCDNNYKSDVVNDISEVLHGGSLTFEELEKHLYNAAKIDGGANLFYKPSDVLTYYNIKFKRGQANDPDNLIQVDRFYYHPRLQVVPPPPTLKIEDDGTITSSYEEESFYLEMVDSFTIKDLLSYFYSKKNSSIQESTFNRDIGALRHLLQFWDVDFLLFLIDEAFASSIDQGREVPNSPLDIQEFSDDALLLYESRKNILYEEGLDHVIPRVRK